MSNELRYDGRVAIVTGSGNGLGRAHALLLGSRGAKVVVNDLGGGMHGGGSDTRAAQKVVDEIKAAGGEAIANYDSVENGDAIIKTALDAYGKVDIVINNAGILRDVSFQKMTDEDWDAIYRVHVLGAYKVTKAAWNHMRDAGYGRIIVTSSAAGIYGNFGQANYSLAKLGLVGFAQTLALEGKKKNVHVNAIAPIAGSRMTETVLPPELLENLKPEYVAPLVAWLCHDSCQENGSLFEVGGGFYAKLRWERTKGKAFGVGKPVSIEKLKSTWSEITDFKNADHPADITSSMQPILDNLSKKSKGGNEFIDVDQALGFVFPPFETSYEERDLALYALGVGAAKDPLDKNDLKFVYEMAGDGFQAIPTFAVTPVLKGILERAKAGEQAPGLNYGFDRILHGEQYLELARPLPPNAKLRHENVIKDIWDKGKHGVVVIEAKTYDAKTNELLATNEISMVVRGAGGWGGERGPMGEANLPPDRAPDASTTQKIDENQALLYRLTGDWNPLHADPDFAKNFGFDKPILHELCTFGYAARHAINAFEKGDARKFKSIRARFADSVFPGETLVTDMWKVPADPANGRPNDKIVLRCKVKERDKVVLSHGAIELYAEIPKPKAAAKPAAAAPAAAAAAPAVSESAAIFDGLGFYIEQNPDLAKTVQTVFQFELSNPASSWNFDLKAGKVTPGKADKPDCTLALSDADFIGMAKGELDPQKLFFGGQLKITGNVMASQKLNFMKKIDRAKLQADLAKAGRLPGAGTTAAAPAPQDGDKDAFNSADAFAVIKDYVEKNPDLVKSVATTYQFELKGPDTSWTLDLKNGAGSVAPGKLDKADCTLEMADSDWIAMVKGEADAQKLYFAQKIKISGNLMASQKLMFLKKIDPKQAAEVVAKSRAAGTTVTAPVATAAAAKEANGPAFQKKLGELLAKEPSLAKELGASVAFVVKDPDTTFTIGADGKIAAGAAKEAVATLRVADGDIPTLKDVRDAYMHGLVRIDGDPRVAHRLGFLKAVV
jgi:3-hydroxyacyl-CoA dehydrogenase/3a,7a,12a-trihydroxy-5b-cholest-24-enoyl-CoA hydratase